MKTTNISRIRLSLLTSITIIGGGAFWLSAVYAQLQDNTRTIGEMLEEQRASNRSLAGMKTDIEVMRVKIEAMEKPVMHTHHDVQALRKDIAILNLGPLSPFFKSPLTMRGE